MLEHYSTKEKEILVFEWFQSCAPLEIVSFIHVGDEKWQPDIIATCKSGEQIAFELTQVDHSDYMRTNKTSDDLTAYLSKNRGKFRHLERLSGYSFRISFTDDAKFSERQALADQAIELVNRNGPLPRQLLFDRKGNFAGTVRCSHQNIDYPFELVVSNALHLGDVVAERIAVKFTQRHDTNLPLHLLGWMDSNLLADDWKADVAELVKTQSKYQRVWVFKIATTVAFDSGGSVL